MFDGCRAQPSVALFRFRPEIGADALGIAAASIEEIPPPNAASPIDGAVLCRSPGSDRTSDRVSWP